MSATYTVTERFLKPIREVLTDEKRSTISASFFASIAAVEFDVELLDMDAEAYLAEVEEGIQITIPDLIRARIVAAQLAFTTDRIYEDAPVFVEFANLTNVIDPPVPEVFNPADALECAVARLELELIDAGAPKPYKTPDDVPTAFSDEVRAYYGGILRSEGAAWPVKPLEDALMPPFDELADPAVFQLLEGKTKDLETELAAAVWQHGKLVFDNCKKLPTADGDLLMPAERIKNLDSGS